MSHALLLVAIPESVIRQGRNAIEDAVDFQMAPYGENEWFADGSRWDWWVIGGRWTGCLDGYDPRDDPRNIETCDLCNGTGTRRDAVVLASPGGVREGHCNGCSSSRGGLGQRLKWPTCWAPHDDWCARDAVPADRGCAAFLHDRHWHEAGRMGWFGSTIQDEADSSDGDLMRFRHDDGSESLLSTHNVDEDTWADIVQRLISEIPADRFLVAVDYHV